MANQAHERDVSEMLEAERLKRLLAYEVAQAAKQQVVNWAKWIVGALVVVAATLGIKTYYDINAAIEKSATEQITKASATNEKALADFNDKSEQALKTLEEKRATSLNELETAYKARSDSIYKRALIDRANIAIVRARIGDMSNLSSTRPRLTPDEREQVIRVLTDATTELSLFRDADRVLRETSTRISWRPIAKLYSELLSSSSEQYKWMKNDPDKQAVVIASMSQKRAEDAKEPVRTILQNKSAPEKLLVTALKYAADIGDRAAIESFETLFRNASHPLVSQQALLGLGRLKPQSELLIGWIKELEERADEPITIGRLAQASDLVASIMDGDPNLQRDDPKLRQRRELAVKVFHILLKRQVRYYISASERGWDQSCDLSIATADNAGELHIVDPYVLFGRVTVFASILRDLVTTARVEEFAQTVDAISARVDDDSPRRAATVYLELDEGGAIVLEDGRTIDKNTPGELRLTTEHSSGRPRVVVSLGKEGAQKGILREVKNAERVSIHVKANVPIGSNSDPFYDYE